jgi:hypothetical protein
MAQQCGEGGQVLRIGVNIPPLSVGTFSDPVFLHTLLKSYVNALEETPVVRPFWEQFPQIRTMKDILQQYPEDFARNPIPNGNSSLPTLPPRNGGFLRPYVWTMWGT